MQLTGWKKRIYNHTVGIGEMNKRDEYQLQEMNKELAVAGMVLYRMNMIAMFIMLIIDTSNNTLSSGTIVLLCINLLYSIYTVVVTRKNNLMDMECVIEEEYRGKRKELRKSSVKASVSWGLYMFIFMCYVSPYLSTGEIDVSSFDAILWACGGGFFGLSMYIFGMWHLKKLY
jgi:uncharacterized membrane protein YqjE